MVTQDFLMDSSAVFKMAIGNIVAFMETDYRRLDKVIKFAFLVRVC